MRAPALIPLTLLIPALAFAGCANSTATSNSTQAAKVIFKSPAIPTTSATTTHALPAQYTCDGHNINPPLEWGTIPTNTGELVLAAIALTPVHGTQNYTATIDWAISGIKPSLHKLNAGENPPGSHIGLAPNGKRRYNICPPKHTTTHYQFMLYGVPANAKVSPIFADQPILTTLTKPNTPTTTTAQGALLTTYTRK